MKKVFSEKGHVLLKCNEEELPGVQLTMKSFRGLVAIEQYLGIRISHHTHKFPLDPYPKGA